MTDIVFAGVLQPVWHTCVPSCQGPHFSFIWLFLERQTGDTNTFFFAVEVGIAEIQEIPCVNFKGFISTWKIPYAPIQCYSL